MTVVVLVSHGRLAEAVLRTAEMIIGRVEGVDTISLEPGMGPDEVTRSLRATMAAIPSGIGVLALLDLFGGSPATACARLLAESDRLEVVTGMNLPMLLEVLLNKDRLEGHDLARLAVEKGKEGVIDVRAVLNNDLSVL